MKKHMSLLAAAVWCIGAYAAGLDSLSGGPTVAAAVTAPIDATGHIAATTRCTSVTAPAKATPSATAGSGTGGVATVVTARRVDTIGPAPQPIPPMPPPMPLPPQVTGAAPLSTEVPVPPVLAPISVRPVKDMVTAFPSPQAPAPIIIDQSISPECES